MTREAAISILRHELAVCKSDQPMKHYALMMSIEVFEKQIPKKPIHMHKNYYCPVCKENGWMMWDDAIPNDMDNYCGKCGQRIDWSDIK